MDWLAGVRTALTRLHLSADTPTAEDLGDLLPWALDQVNPRLRLASGYPRTYLASLGKALAYCHSLADRVPAPVTVNRAAFARDAVVHALFGSADSIVQSLVSSQAVRDWSRAHPEATEAYALLGVRLQTRNIMGMTLRNDTLQREVSQQVVYFTDHTFSGLADSEAAARELLLRRFMESLLGRVLERVQSLQDRRHELEQARDEAQARLRQHPEDPQARQALERVLAELGDSISQAELAAYPAHFAAVMDQAETYLRLQPRILLVDALGVCQEADAPHGGTYPIQLLEMQGRDRRKWHVSLVRCDLAEVPSYPDRLQQAGRWLAI
jgi:hypothetical protein